MRPAIQSLRWIAGCAAALYALSVPPAAAQAVPEYDLKAAFIYNFALFTEWPGGTLGAGGTLNVCVNPNSALRPALASLNDKLVKGHRLAVRQLAAADALQGCHILFLDGSDRGHWRRIKKDLGGASVLTVSDDSEIGLDGAIIALVMDGNRIAFEVDIEAARQARLTLSSKLLRLAKGVQ